MKKLVVLLLVSLMAASAFATIDPDADMIGIYFDTTADNNCATVAPGTPVNAYCIATGLSAVDLNAVEFSYEVVSSNIFPGGIVFNNGGTNLLAPPLFSVGFLTAFPGNGENAVLFSQQIFVTGPAPVEFFMGPSTPESIVDGLPAYNESASVIHPLGLSNGDANMPIATINGDCPVANEDLSFGSVKSLFR